MSNDSSSSGGPPPAGAPPKPWGGRFREDTDPTVERFSASVHFDHALARYDIRLSLAHARMLRKTGLLSAEDEAALLSGLERIAGEVEAGTLLFEGAEGGGIPLIRTLHGGMAGNDITACRGIIHGTSNYILTRMIGETVSCYRVVEKLGSGGS